MDKIITIVVDILSGVLGFLFLIFAILAYSNTVYDSNSTLAYKNNWMQSPIKSIISTSQSTCPSGFEPMISTTFPGNVQGCDCTQSQKKDYSHKLFKSACEEDMILSDCRIIKEVNDIPLAKWQEKSLCVKRMGADIGYANYTQNAYLGSCPLNMKKCGILDTANNFYCALKEEECPINHLEIIPKTEEPFYSDEDFELNAQYVLHYSNKNPDGHLVVSVIASPSLGEVCSHPYEGLLGENNYTLNKRQGESSCKTKQGNYLFDWRYTLLDSSPLNKFYSQNRIDKLISYQPQYPLPKDSDKVMLHATNYFGVNSTCLKKGFTPSFLTPDIKSLETRAFSMVVICILQMIFLVCAVFVYKIASNYLLSKPTSIVIDIIEASLLLLIFSLALGFGLSVQSEIKPYNNFISNSCGDELTSSLLKDAFTPLYRSGQYYTVIYSLALIGLGMKAVYYFWFYLFSKNSN